MASEREIQADIQLAASRAGYTTWRNNVGTGWAGQVEHVRVPGPVQVRPGDVVVRNARPLHAGLCKGSGDLIGLRPILILPEHVGQTIAQFTSLEVKTPKGRPTEHQLRFAAFIRSQGGIGVIIRSPDELP